MTEAGRKWVDEKMANSESTATAGFPGLEDFAQAEFWIRAFCEQVRAEIGEWHSEKGDQYHEILGYAFANIESELLGE